MEEVDTILLQQLKDVGCPLDEERATVGDLEPNEVILSAAHCLSLIDAHDDQLKSISASNLNMATKYKVASHLASKCLSLGFKGDLGYQCFLYGAETEIRRLLLFLIEKLPKDEDVISPVASSAKMDVVSRLRRKDINVMWLPPMHDDSLSKQLPNDYYQSRSIAGTFISKSIVMNKMAPARVNYYDNYASASLDIGSLINWSVWQQSSAERAPSSRTVSTKFEVLQVAEQSIASTASQLRSAQESALLKSSGPIDENETKQSYEERMAEVISTLETDLQQLTIREADTKRKCDKLGDQVTKLEQEIKTEKDRLIEMRSRDKTIDDLKAEARKQKEDFEAMQEQWGEMEIDLKSQVASIKASIDEKNSSVQRARKELEEIKKELSTKQKMVKEREALANELNERMPEKLPPGRTSYTKRIIEIVNNVKKQNQETKKVLTETRAVQKEINNLQGKVQRAFHVTDDAINRDTKGSDWHRRCYKLLKSMRENCDLIMAGIEGTGLIRRDVMKLEELLDKEQTKMVASNLVRIQADLKQIQIENEKLRNMHKEQSSKQEE